MVAVTKKRQGLALASAADPRAQSMACGTMLPTLVLRGALEMLWRGVAIPPFHSIFISFLSFHFLPLLSTSFHAPVPVPVAVFSFSFSFLLLSLPLRSCPVLFLCSVFPSFFLSSPAPVLSLPFPLRFLFLSLLDSRGEIWTSSRAACNRFLSLPSPNLLISRRLVL